MITGKGMYIWKIKECEGGVISDIVTMCQNANFSHVIIKIADGTSGYNFTEDDGDMAKALVDALKAVDIEPWGFQYIYGVYPIQEALTANRRIEETGVVGFVINAEGEIKNIANNGAIVAVYCDSLNDHLPWVLSSYRYPEEHPKFPWQTFVDWLNKDGDFMMPQVYWMDAHNPAEQLRECLRQYVKITDLPILPTGSAFCEHGWCPTNEEIEEFATESEVQGLPGINFWEWAATRKGGFWKTVRDIDYILETPQDCCEELWEAVEEIQNRIDAVGKTFLLQNELNKVLEGTAAGLASDLVTLRVKEKAHAEEIKALYHELETANAFYHKRIDGLEERLGLQELITDNNYMAFNEQIAELEEEIEDLFIQCDHVHPAWMVRLGLVKENK